MGRQEPFLSDPNSKVYTTGERDFVRITTLIDTLSKPALVPWAAREERQGILAILEREGFRDSQSLLAALGKRNGSYQNGNPKYCHQNLSGDAMIDGGNAHDLLQNALCAAQGWPSRWSVPDASEKARKAAAAGLAFCARHEVIPVALEKLVWSEQLGVAGTMDFLGTMVWEGSRIQAVLDWKTGAAIYDEMALQVAFYRLAFLEQSPDANPNLAGGIVRLPKEGGKAEIRLWMPDELDACEPVIRGLREAWAWREAMKEKR